MRVHRFISRDLTLRVAAVDATQVVAEMQQLHQSMPLATLGVGRAMVGALLMAAQLKPGQEVGLLFKGNGPLGSLYAQASYEGAVRGYCPNPHYQAPVDEDMLKVGKALGFGHLTVSRQQPFQKQPFTGTVELATGEVGEDLAHYLMQSHQIRSLVSLGVYLDTYGQVKAAGGLMLEVMPGVEENVVEKVQANADLQKESISKMIFEGKGPEQLIAPYLVGIPYTEIPHDFDIAYSCPCTKTRVREALVTLGEQDLRQMIADKEKAEVQCQMCGRNYEMEVTDLESLVEEIRRNSMH